MDQGDGSPGRELGPDTGGGYVGGHVRRQARLHRGQAGPPGPTAPHRGPGPRGAPDGRGGRVLHRRPHPDRGRDPGAATRERAGAPAPAVRDRSGLRGAAVLLALVAALVTGYAVGRAAGPTAPPAAGGAATQPTAGHTHPAAGSDAGGLAVSAGGFTLMADATAFTAGVAAPLRFRIVGAGNAPVTKFALNGDRPLHLIVVRRDLTGYQHLHPTMAPDGIWSIPLTLPTPGAWRAFADFV